MQTVLFTGFEPFDGATDNPSWQVAQMAAAGWDGPGRAVARCLPVSFAQVPRVLAQVLRDVQPAVVVAAGQGPVPAITFERFAVNLIDARIGDNDGQEPVDAEILPGRPTAYRAGVPIKLSARRVHAKGLPVNVSNSAGTYVCNQTFYLLCDWVACGAAAKVGFVHLPRPTPQEPALTIESMAQALGILARTALEVAHDVKVALASLSVPRITV